MRLSARDEEVKSTRPVWAFVKDGVDLRALAGSRVIARLKGRATAGRRGVRTPGRLTVVADVAPCV